MGRRSETFPGPCSRPVPTAPETKGVTGPCSYTSRPSPWGSNRTCPRYLRRKKDRPSDSTIVFPSPTRDLRRSLRRVLRFEMFRVCGGRPLTEKCSFEERPRFLRAERVFRGLSAPQHRPLKSFTNGGSVFRSFTSSVHKGPRGAVPATSDSTTSAGPDACASRRPPPPLPTGEIMCRKSSRPCRAPSHSSSCFRHRRVPLGKMSATFGQGGCPETGFPPLPRERGDTAGGISESWPTGVSRQSSCVGSFGYTLQGRKDIPGYCEVVGVRV